MLLIAITITYGPICIKSYRVWLIFDNPTMRKRRISNQLLLGYLLIYIVLELIVITIAATNFPVEAADTNLEVSQYETVPRVTCTDTEPYFAALAYLLAAIPLVASLFIAFKTRHYGGVYSEHWSITIALYTLLFAGVTSIPFAYMLGSQSAMLVFYFKAVAVFGVSIISITALMAPKIVHVHRGTTRVTDTTTTLGMSRINSHSASAKGSSMKAGSTSAHNESLRRDPLSEVPNSMATLDELENEILELRAEVKEQKEIITQLRARLGEAVCSVPTDAFATGAINETTAELADSSMRSMEAGAVDAPTPLEQAATSSEVKAPSWTPSRQRAAGER